MENKEHPELIVCAAIKFQIETATTKPKPVDELVLPMVRHYSMDSRNVLNFIDDYYDVEEIEQGFITNFGRFINRKEALEIAKANNQIRFDIGYEPDELYSEMLY
ncbi:hypothetical protein [Rodentibacter pneumotropicus]|uniref:Uncharacterized protein n=1 Tax=Rodentibacter pneumotropicus TaxID=758 RepID=A0A4S2PZ92_9PAST|nr:hypothetical protein [Rodentibacter pneumotropicus]THA09433.1 hypothetical protein D3M77_02155 [Rodentibacter pneumotropicus]THA12422.1 hypothetical protein D3M76_09985 [Rodentibacter pneumotropicus]